MAIKKHKKKIGIMIDRLNIGGVEKTAIKQVIELNKLGEDAKLLILSRKSIVEDAFLDLLEDVPVEYLEDRLPKILRFTFKLKPFAFFSFFHISYAFLLPMVIKKKEFDYIVSHGSYTSFSALGMYKFKHIPYSIYFWDPIGYILNRVYTKKIPTFIIKSLNIIANSLDRALVQNSKYVITPSNTHYPYFTNVCNCPMEKLVSINPGAPLGTPSVNKKPEVLLVTAYKAGKDPNYLLEIAKKLPNTTFNMAGEWLDDELLRDFKIKRTEYGLEKTVKILGLADEQRLAKLYPTAAIHLTTNLEVGFGMPVLEAAAWGTISIVPKGSGVCVVFKDKEEAFYTKEKDTKHIVKIIKDITSNLDKAKSMGQKAFEKVKKEHTWNVHAKKLRNIVYSD